MELLYLNANLLYGECLKLLEHSKWKRKIKIGVISKLRDHNFTFTTSILTKTEILQRLIREESCSIKKARNIFSKILEKYDVILISSLNKRNLLTNTFMDLVASSNLDFKDALHLDIASKKNLIVVTHDKKFRENFSKQQDKFKFYSKVVKPEELFNN